jgi:DNA-directed RNA polymerase specialized sigma24 family protein
MSRDSSSAPDAPRQFATTRWSLVHAAGRKSTPDAAAALQSLCLAYWFPLYAFVRREGHQPEEARDLTQSFFVSLLERDDLGSVSPEKGRFRSFLLASMKHFLVNAWHKGRALKRGGGRRPLSLDFDAAESRLQVVAVDHQTPQGVFEREWAVTLLERVRALLEIEFSAGRGEDHFDHLQRYLTPDAAAPTYAETADRLQTSEAAVKQAVHRLRRRFGELLRAEIAQTVSTPEEIDDEIRALMSALQRSG